MVLIVLKPKNFISILFISELVWIVLYIISILVGSIYSDITLLSMSFFILGIAGLEFSLGILLIVLYKNLNESLDIDMNNKTNNKDIYDKNFKISINKINWN